MVKAMAKNRVSNPDGRVIAEDDPPVLDEEVEALLDGLGVPPELRQEYAQSLANLISTVMDDYIKDKSLS